MALKQLPDRSYDALTKLSEQQLRSILAQEMEAEDIDYELVKGLADILAAKSNIAPVDTDSAFHRFASDYADTEPLYDITEEGGDGADGVKETESSHEAPHKVIRFSKLARIGLVVAAIIAFVLMASAVASAMGFNILSGTVTWDKDNMEVSSVSGKIINSEDPYSRLRETLAAQGVDRAVVPSYLPEGFSLEELTVTEIMDGKIIDAVYSKGENQIFLSYSLSIPELNIFYPKDDVEPDFYQRNNIEHVITVNDGTYRAVWSNGEMTCMIYGPMQREELLKIIDSIYEE